MKDQRTKEQVLALAKAMAERYWGNSQVSARLASETLVAGLTSSRFTVEVRSGTTTYNVSDPSYVQLYVDHSFSSGIDRVSIAWQGEFSHGR